MIKTPTIILGLAAQLAMAAALASELTIRHSFTAGTPARASEVNTNFTDVETAVDDNFQQIGVLDTGLTAVEADLAAQKERITALETAPRVFGYASVITVAPSSGDFASVAAATASIADSSASNPYLVRVMPGVYNETDLVQVPSFVHLRGSGPNVTIVTSSRSGPTQSPDSATVAILDNARLSDLTVINDGTASDYGIALYSEQTSRATIVDNVHAEANGAGGSGHFAAYWNDAEAIIRDSTLIAAGATGFGSAVNAAFASVNIADSFPRALIENSTLLGGDSNSLVECVDNTGTGFGLLLSNSSPRVRHSEICGGHRGVSVATNGQALIHSSVIKVSSTGSAFLFEITAAGSISVANSGVSYIGNKFTGAGTGLRCVHNYQWGSHAPVDDGTTAATACE